MGEPLIGRKITLTLFPLSQIELGELYLEVRNDIGNLWENFLVAERLKKQSYQQIYFNNYFWRTWNQKEIDWVEEIEGKLFGYELKWQNKRSKALKAWKENYPEAPLEIISQENYLPFVKE